MSFKSKLIFSLLLSTATISMANAQHDLKNEFEVNNFPNVAAHNPYNNQSSCGFEDVTEEFEAREEARNLEQAIAALKSQTQQYIDAKKSEEDVFAMAQNIAVLTEQLYQVREKFEGGKAVNAHRQVSQSLIEAPSQEKNALSKSTSSIEKGSEDFLESEKPLKKSKSATFGDKFFSILGSDTTSKIQKTEDSKSPKSVNVKAVSQNHQTALVIEDGFNVIDLNDLSTSHTPAVQPIDHLTIDEEDDELDILIEEAMLEAKRAQQRVQVANKDSKEGEANFIKLRRQPEKPLPLSLTKGKKVHVNGNSVVIQEEVTTSGKDQKSISIAKMKNQPAKALPLSLTNGKKVHVNGNSVVILEEVKSPEKDTKVALNGPKKKAKVERPSLRVERVAVSDTPLARSVDEEILTQEESKIVDSSQVEVVSSSSAISQPVLDKVVTNEEIVSTPEKSAGISSFVEKIKESKAYAYLTDKRDQFVKFAAPIKTRFTKVIERAKETTAFQIFKGFFN